MCEGPLRGSWTGPHKLDLNQVQRPCRDPNGCQQRLAEPEQTCSGRRKLDAVVTATRQLFLGRTGEPPCPWARLGWDWWIAVVTSLYICLRLFPRETESRFGRRHVNLHTNT